MAEYTSMGLDSGPDQYPIIEPDELDRFQRIGIKLALEQDDLLKRKVEVEGILRNVSSERNRLSCVLLLGGTYWSGEIQDSGLSLMVRRSLQESGTHSKEHLQALMESANLNTRVVFQGRLLDEDGKRVLDVIDYKVNNVETYGFK